MSCQVNLGNMYYNGLGVAQSKERAKVLYQQAAEGGDKNAKLLLEELQQEEAGREREEGEGRRGGPGDDEKS